MGAVTLTRLTDGLFGGRVPMPRVAAVSRSARERRVREGAKDATGSFVWVDPTGRATIAFRFATASRADGEARRLAVPSDPCSATWPLMLTR